MQNTHSLEFPTDDMYPSFFSMTKEELEDWEQFYNEDDQPLPTDLMVAMINLGMIVHD